MHVYIIPNTKKVCELFCLFVVNESSTATNKMFLPLMNLLIKSLFCPNNSPKPKDVNDNHITKKNCSNPQVIEKLREANLVNFTGEKA